MKLFRLRAFPKTPYGGNKAGVVLDADCLSDSGMQDIAREVGYSETAFVTKSQVADIKTRFFTPTQEVDLCGHATIATFNVMRDEGRLEIGRYTQETKAGILALDVQKDSVYMQQNPPQFYEVLTEEDIKQCFLEQNIIDARYPIQVVSTGLKEIFLPIKSVDILHSLTPKFDQIVAVSKHYNTIGIHAFALDDEVDAYGRNFAPVVGIDEESATGTSNGALACYLHQYVTRKENYILRQGYSMNQPSEIHANIKQKQDDITDVWVGGSAIVITEQVKK